MERHDNPFSPGAGSPPPKLVGRDEILQQALTALARIKRGRSEKSILLVGLRGTGKTVLLNEISKLAEEQQYQSVIIEAHEQKTLPAILLPELRRVLFSLDSGKNISSLEADLAQLFIALGEAAKDRETAVAIIIDELQYVKEEELSSLIMAIHRISQKSLPVVLIGAGLPQLVGITGRAKSYAERLFDYPEIGPLKNQDAKIALASPVEKENVFFTPDAIDEIIRVTEGYPYFLQEWGYQAWNIAAKSPIDLSVVKQATTASLQRLDQSFFRVRFDRLTPREQEYLRALAELGAAPQRSGDVAEKLGIDVKNAGPLRNGLIKKGMIYSPKHGDTAFTVPLFEAFMKRIMPMQKTTK